MKHFKSFLNEQFSLKDFGLSFTYTKNLGINNVFRTEKAHKTYKGKANYGKGRYYTLKQEDAEEYTLNPESSKIEYYDPKVHGKIDTHGVLRNMKVVVFDLEDDQDFKNLETIRKKVNNKLEKFFLDNGIHGMVIKSENMNYGGNQLVDYTGKYVR